jgi:pimeloyl-ACP methyl ester carboxylesterase
MKISAFNSVLLIWLIIFFVPVILLAVATSVPAMIWYSLFVIYLGLITLLISYPWSRKIATGMMIVGLCLSVIAFVASAHFASTPAIKDIQGEIIPESIASLEKVQLGGRDQWISVRSMDKNNPVLLILADGPGWSGLASTRLYLSGLEDNFIVVNWDQPGLGKSFRSVSPQDLSLERYLSDAIELVKLLQDRSGQQKIYLLGESWGSFLGVQLVQTYPDEFYAYIGSGQMINLTKNDQMAYRFALEIAEERGDANLLEKTIGYGPPPYEGVDSFIKYYTYMSYLDKYVQASIPGIGTSKNDFLDTLFAPEYSLVEKIYWPFGMFGMFNTFYQNHNDLDLLVDAPRLDIPVYFVHGRYDLDAMPVLLEEYYNALEAPSKKLIWFEYSGHKPPFEETGKFLEVMIDQVLAETYPNP